MPDYHTFTSARTTMPDWPSVLTSIRTAVADPTVGGWPDPGRYDTYTLKRNGVWSAPDIAATQTLIDNAPPLTPQMLAQRTIDAYPIEVKALVLALIDQLNVIRAALPSPLQPITPAAALAAIRQKAGTL
jgi:hypothetical protein